MTHLEKQKKELSGNLVMIMEYNIFQDFLISNMNPIIPSKYKDNLRNIDPYHHSTKKLCSISLLRDWKHTRLQMWIK